MKYKKILSTLAVTAFLLALSHTSTAAEKNAAKQNISPTTTNIKTKNYVTKTKLNTKTIAKDEANVFSGSVDFTMGKDSNIDPDKTKVEGSFFQINPKLNFKAGNWEGSFGASIKDFAKQDQSDLYKQNEATAQGSYTAKISKITTSTTTLSALYHDEKWPDYINTGSGYDSEGNTQSMAIRYSDISLQQKLGFNFGSLSSELGGSLKHRDSYSLYSDFAPDIFGAKPFEKDYNELTAFGKLTLAAASFLDLSLKPSIKQTKYDEREGRLTDGTAGGIATSSPLYELINSEVAVDAAFKFSESNITPTALVGQQSDKANGAEDTSYYGFGLSSTLVLHKGTKLTLTPNIMYKKINYDNWIKAVQPVNEKRVDDETSTGVNASIQLAKNFGIGAGYSMVREKSNIVTDTSENYRQEIVSSSLTFNF